MRLLQSLSTPSVKKKNADRNTNSACNFYIKHLMRINLICFVNRLIVKLAKRLWKNLKVVTHHSYSKKHFQDKIDHVIYAKMVVNFGNFFRFCTKLKIVEKRKLLNLTCKKTFPHCNLKSNYCVLWQQKRYKQRPRH